MASFLDDNADLQYYLSDGIDWATVVSLGELGYRQPDGFKDLDEAMAFVRDVAAMVGAFAADEVAPHTAEIDRAGVRFADGGRSFRRGWRRSSTSCARWACTA
jgi:hypothetical protein